MIPPMMSMDVPNDPAVVAPDKEGGSAVDLYPPIEVVTRSPATRPARSVPAKRSNTVESTAPEGDGEKAKEPQRASSPPGRKRKLPPAAAPPVDAPSPTQAPQAVPHASAFGWVELHGTRYEFDVIVHVDGTVTQRDKSLSRRKKEKYGHTPLTGKELLALKAEAPEMIIIGTGHSDAMPLTPKAEKMLDEHEFFVGSTPRALVELAASRKRTVALLHVTC